MTKSAGSSWYKETTVSQAYPNLWPRFHDCKTMICLSLHRVSCVFSNCISRLFASQGSSRETILFGGPDPNRSCIHESTIPMLEEQPISAGSASDSVPIRLHVCCPFLRVYSWHRVLTRKDCPSLVFSQWISNQGRHQKEGPRRCGFWCHCSSRVQRSTPSPGFWHHKNCIPSGPCGAWDWYLTGFGEIWNYKIRSSEQRWSDRFATTDRRPRLEESSLLPVPTFTILAGVCEKATPRKSSGIRDAWALEELVRLLS